MRRVRSMLCAKWIFRAVFVSCSEGSERGDKEQRHINVFEVDDRKILRQYKNYFLCQSLKLVSITGTRLISRLKLSSRIQKR